MLQHFSRVVIYVLTLMSLKELKKPAEFLKRVVVMATVQSTVSASWSSWPHVLLDTRLVLLNQSGKVIAEEENSKTHKLSMFNNWVVTL